MNLPKQAFTLVELIVVITILAILGTIAFLSFQGYSRDARDSVRISDLNNISRGMEFMLTKTGRLPVPEDSVEITASGTIISYQGYAGENVLSTIGVNNGGKDPKDDEFYTYVSNANYNKYQILGFLENGDQIGLSELNQVNADLSERFPVTEGFELGVIIDSITQIPIQLTGDSVDLASTVQNYNTYLSTTNFITGSGSELVKVASYNIRYGSCNEILNTYGVGIGNGNYRIYTNNNEVKVLYCDMNTDGGGWTLVTPSMITEYNQDVTSDITYDMNGGLIYKASDFNHGCGVNEDSRQEMKLPNDINWDEIKFTQEFYGSVSCWDIFGRKRGSYKYDTNITQFSQGFNVVRNEIRMGGSDGDLFSGITYRCDNVGKNFWVGSNGVNIRSAEVILDRTNSTKESYLSTGLSCVGNSTYFQYSGIFIR